MTEKILKKLQEISKKVSKGDVGLEYAFWACIIGSFLIGTLILGIVFISLLKFLFLIFMLVALIRLLIFCIKGINKIIANLKEKQENNNIQK